MSARQDGGHRDPGRADRARPAALAFFDVDETLVADKTIFSFLRHHYAAAGRDPGDYPRIRARLRRQAEAGTPREEVNRAYYRLFAGSTAAELEKSGAAWFANQLTGDFFHPPALEALRAHAAAGDTVVLVSGSFFACLDPIARYVG
ncbi:MAG: haloacid dehalogenase-like hydrolase, partial [Catenulispora sp.]